MSYEPHQKTPLSGQYIDENSPRYRLCCCHVRIWAIVIGILELIGLVLQLLGGVGGYVAGLSGTKDTYAANTGISGLVGGIIGIVIGVIVVALMLYGVNKVRPGFVIPHLVFQMIGIVFLIIAAISYFVIAGLYGSSRNRDKQNSDAVIGAFAGAGAAMLVVVAVEIFFFYAILRAYRYLKDKRFATEAVGHVPMATSYSSVEKGRHIS